MIYIYKFIYNVSHVIEGYLKWLYDVLTGNGSVYSVKRLEICRACKHKRRGICGLCGCVIKAKVRVKYPLDDDGKSIDGCPEKKW